jgi:Transposase DDE domain
VVATRPSSAKGARARREPSVEEQLDSLSIPFLDKFDELFDHEDIWAAGRRLGVIERKRKLDLPALVEATVLTLNGPDGPQTTIMGNYFTLSGRKVAPSSFYDWFDAAFAELLAELAGRAIEAVRVVQRQMDDEPDPEGSLLARLGDVRITDASSVLLRKLAQVWAPSTNKKRPAGIKLHTVIALGDSLPVEYHTSAQRRNDSPELDESAFERGTLAIYDLAYVNHARELRLLGRGVHVLRRLKTRENPRIVKVVKGRAKRKPCRGRLLDDALDEGLLQLGGVIDLDVELRSKDDAQIVRVVGIEGPDKETRWYMTSVPRERLAAQDVADAYSLRWEVELLFKAFKSGVGLDKILAWRKDAVLALVNAKVIAIALAKLLELTAHKLAGPHAVTQLAIVLTLARMTPLIMSMRLSKRGVDLAEMERRLLMITLDLARSRKKRRERTKREKLRKTRGKSA